MKIEEIKTGQPVVYIPEHLLGNKKFSDNQLGIVTSKNDTYIFVAYKGNNHSQATRPEDLFSLDNRPDLMERLGIEVKPINRVCELYLQEKKNIQKIINPIL